MKTFFTLFLSVCALICAAEELNSASVWRKGAFKEGVLMVKTKEFSSCKMTVNPKLDYCFSFEYRALPGGKSGTLRAGFRLYDAQKREIRPFHVILRTTAPAEVAENVKKGDKSVKLRAAGSWKKLPHYSLAFYAKPDLSDLPNFNTFEGYVADFQKEGSNCTITFKKPLEADVPEGTLVRSHRYGGEFYPAVVTASEKWQKAEFTLSGIAKTGRDNNIEQWNPGTTVASLYFAGSAEIRNITVKTFEKGKAPVSEKKKPVNKNTYRSFDRAEQQFEPSVKIKAFYPNGVNGFFLPQEELKFTVAFEGKLPCDAEIQLFDYQGKVLKSKRFKGEKKAVAVSFPAPGKNGYFPAVCKVWNNKKLCAESKAGAIVMPPVARRDPWFGLNHNGLNKRLRDGYIRLGIGMLGISFCPEHIDSLGKGSVEKYIENRIQRNEWIVNDKEFACYGALSTAFKGRSVAMNLVAPDPGTKEVARCIKEDFFPVTEEFFLKTRDLARRVAQRYKGRISVWHVGEEIDASVKTSPPRGGTSSGTLTAYILMAKQLYRGIKAGNPDAHVEVLGIAGGDWRETPQFPLCKLILKDLGKCFDGVYIDAYSGNWNSARNPATAPEEGNLLGYLTDSAALSAAYGRPYAVANAERGYASNYFESPFSANNKQLADYTARSLIIAKSAPCTGFVIFKDITVTFPNVAHKRPELAVEGFWDCDIWRAVWNENKQTVGVPKAMCLAIAVAARELGFTRFASRLAPGNGVQCAVFDREKSGSVAAVWTTGSPLNMVCKVPAGTVMVDFQGNEKELSGEIRLHVSGSPFYLRSSAASSALKDALEKADYPVEIAAVGEGRVCGKGQLLIQIADKSGKDLKGTLVMPDGTKSAVSLKKFALNSVKTAIPAKAGNAQLILPGMKSVIIPLDLERTVIPQLKTAPKFDGSGAWMKSVPAIELKVPDNVMPKRALQWELGLFRNDGTDISVKLYPAWDAKNFYLGAVVRDRSHIQRHHNSSIWQDDVLQFALSPRFDTVKPELNKNLERSRYGVLDYSFGAALTRQGVYLHSWSKALKGAVQFPANITRKGEYTTYEIAVPWETIKFVPAAGKALRFSSLVMNVDSPEQPSAPYHLDFGGGIAGKEDVSLFKTILLGD